MANGVGMPGRGIDEIDRELSHLATVHADVRRRGGQITTYLIDGLLDERLMLCGVSDDPPTEEFGQIQLPDATPR